MLQLKSITLFLLLVLFSCKTQNYIAKIDNSDIIEHTNDTYIKYKVKLNSKDGYWKIYYANDSLAFEGIVRDGKMNGLWQYYNTEDIIKTTVLYKNHKLHGLALIEDNYKMETIVNYRDDLMNGPYISLDNQKKIQHLTNILNNDENGLSIYFHQNGIPQIVQRYSNGIKVGHNIEFYENGIILKEGCYYSTDSIYYNDCYLCKDSMFITTKYVGNSGLEFFLEQKL